MDWDASISQRIKTPSNRQIRPSSAFASIPPSVGLHSFAGDAAKGLGKA